MATDAQRLTDRGPKERLAELERRPQLGRRQSPRSAARASGATCQLGGLVLVVVHPERRRAPELDVDLDGRVAHRLGEGGQLGQAIESLVGLAQGGERVVAGREEDPSVVRRRHDRQRLLDEPERLLGRVGRERGRRRIDREARRTDGVVGSEGVLGEHRQAGRRRIAAVEQRSTTAAWTCRRRAADSWAAANWRTCSWVNV